MGETWEERMNRLARELVEANKDVFIEAGIVQGHEKGRAEGRAEGHAEGHAEGQAEANRTNAIKMIQLGKLSYDDISAVTGLSIEDIEEIARTEIA